MNIVQYSIHKQILFTLYDRKLSPETVLAKLVINKRYYKMFSTYMQFGLSDGFLLIVSTLLMPFLFEIVFFAFNPENALQLSLFFSSRLVYDCISEKVPTHGRLGGGGRWIIEQYKTRY